MALSIQQTMSTIRYNTSAYHAKSSNVWSHINGLTSKLISNVNIYQRSKHIPEYSAQQLYQEQAQDITAVKERVNSYMSIGDTVLSTQQVDDLKQRYDVDNLNDTDTEHLLDELVTLGVITKTDRNFALGIELPATFGCFAYEYASWVPLEMRRPIPDFDMDKLVKTTGNIKNKLFQKISLCNEAIPWFSDEENKGIVGYEKENCCAFSRLKESSEKVLNVMAALKQS